MSKKSKLLLACGIATMSGLIAGGLFGISEGKDLAEKMLYIKGSDAAFTLSRFVALQSRYSDAAHAREAALLEIAIVGKLGQSGSPFDLRSLAYGRLALAEERLGNQDASLRAFEQARIFMKQSRGHRPDLSNDEIRQWVQKLNSINFL